jgi:SWI/SNF-related matrix-associated actin-dependent regulator 1 of chromatin subfamily A
MKRINVEKKDNEWVAHFEFDYETKDFVKSLGFWFDGSRKVWYTTDATVAAKLDPNAAGHFAKQVEASKAVDADVDIPKPDSLEYLPYQKAGIAYALQRPNTLLCDEMGLGKTIQAIGVINADPSIKSVLVVCPATIKMNWKKELEKWLVRPLSVGIVNGTIPNTDVKIINYDILGKWHKELVSCQWDMLIVDEFHKVKNPKAKRTQFLFGKTAKEEKDRIAPITAKRRLLMSGSPIVNRPIELWPALQAIDPGGIGKNFMGFARRYCNAHQNGYGWDFTGASNLGELQMKLRTSCMVRRLKQDVLTELPAKRRQIVVIPPTGSALKVVQAEKDAFDTLNVPYEEAAEELTARTVAFEFISKVRHATAVAKIPYVISFLEDAMEDNDNKLVLMLHHHDVAHKVAEAFPGSAIVTGETNINKRDAEVVRFQNDPKCRLFIGSIQAAGVGITLTASSHVVFCELDWVPGNVSQAEDRCHRIGQTDSVLVQHLVFDDSIDARMAEIIVQKQALIDSALDKGMVTPKVETVSAKPQTLREKPEPVQSGLTAAQVQAVHTALKLLSAMCDGARELDGAGFNKMDTLFGHSLAERTTLTNNQAEAGKRLVLKYHRQLPADLLVAIRGA